MKNTPAVTKPNIVQVLAERFRVNPDQLMPTLKATAFRQQKGEISDAQMIALMIVANEYGLNPFTKELYAYPDKQGGIVPVVSVDGWNRIVNQHPGFKGVEFRYADDAETPVNGKECPIWIECVMYRTDREKPVVVREYLDECYRTAFVRDDGSVVKGPWQSHTKRMLRHKAFIQCSRIAFGFSGVYDDDEAQRIIERDVTDQGEVVKVEGPRSKSQPARIEDQSPEPIPMGESDNASARVSSPASSAPSPSAGPDADATLQQPENGYITTEQLQGVLSRVEQANLKVMFKARLQAWGVKSADQITPELLLEVTKWLDARKA